MKLFYPEICCYYPDIDYTNRIECYNYRWKEKYLFLMHSILFSSIRNKKNFNGYTNLDSTLLAKLLGERYYKAVLTQLLNSNIIQVLTNKNGSAVYSAGAFSKAYRINPEILKDTRIKAEPIKKQTYCRKLSEVKQKQLTEALKINPNLQHEFLMLTYRMIDVEAATNYIKTNYEEGTPKYNSRIIAVKEFNAMHEANTDLTRYKVNFHFSLKGGRVYSPASMLPRDLEQFTYFIGHEEDKSVCLDMPNSQLCFFNELVELSKTITGEKHLNIEIEKKCQNIGRKEREEIRGDYKNFFQSKSNTSPSHTLPYVVTINPNSWQNVIFRGEGYERMMFLSKWKDKTEGHTKQERQLFKEVFFGELFYNKYKPNYLTPLERVFKEHHHAEATALRSIKSKLGNKLLAIQVQKLEGKFFHDILVRYLKTNYIDVPFTIKHDSITLPKDCASFLIDELNMLVQQFFNRTEIGFKYEEL